MIAPRMSELLDGLRADGGLEVFLELAVIWLVVYAVFRFLQGTRGAGVIKGFLLFTVTLALLVRFLGDATDGFLRLRFLFDRAFSLLAILLIVVFQPEIRAAMSRIGRTKFFLRSRDEAGALSDELAEAATFLSKNRFGAIIVVERETGIGDLLEGGVEIDAKPSAALIQSVFWPNSPLHDLAMVIRGGRIWGAGVQLPLAEEGVLPMTFGSRHRAAVGVTVDSDCLVLVVSEESGHARIAEGGALSPPIAREDLEGELARRLAPSGAIVGGVVAGARAAIRGKDAAPAKGGAS